ncbi:MAG: hypothetical protein AAB794_04000 [Patescibacteria group bacterium]
MAVKGGGARKHGRNQKRCEVYQQTARDQRNAAARKARHEKRMAKKRAHKARWIEAKRTEVLDARGNR